MLVFRIKKKTEIFSLFLSSCPNKRKFHKFAQIQANLCFILTDILMIEAPSILGVIASAQVNSVFHCFREIPHVFRKTYSVRYIFDHISLEQEKLTCQSLATL